MYTTSSQPYYILICVNNPTEISKTTLTPGQNLPLSWLVLFPWVLGKVNPLLRYIDPNWDSFDPEIFRVVPPSDTRHIKI